MTSVIRQALVEEMKVNDEIYKSFNSAYANFEDSNNVEKLIFQNREARE
jgi:hypothetical protein